MAAASPRRQLSRSSSTSPVHSSIKVFLNSSASTQPDAGVAVVDPPGERATLEGDVLPGVDGPQPGAAARMSARNRSTSGPKVCRSTLAVPTLTSGLSSAGAGVCVRAVAAVVVGVHVEQDERSALGEGVEPRREGVVEGVVRRQAPLEQLARQRAAVPDVEAPAVVGAAVDRLAPGPVEVGLEARPAS